MRETLPSYRHGESVNEKTRTSLAELKPHQKRAYIQTLHAMAGADGEEHPDEQAYLFDVVRQLGMTTEQFAACIPPRRGAYQDIVIDAPEDEDIRRQWLSDLIWMVAADGKLARTEYKLSVHFAEKLGFAHKIVEQLMVASLQKR